MILRIRFLPITVLLISITASAQKTSNTSSPKGQFTPHILNIIKALQQKDSTTLQSYIDTTVGCYLLSPYGTLNLRKTASIEFNSYDYSESNFGKYSSKQKVIQFASLPEYNCDKSKWNKKGLYANKTSSIFKFITILIKDYNTSLTSKDLSNMKQIEKNSYWIIYAPDNATAISFQISNVKGKYYLTAIEPVPLYCDI